MAYRVQHRFWLDLDKPDEEALNDLTVDLKRQRLFQATIRDGIRLIYDLRAGRLDVLFELFPWVQSELESRADGTGDGTNKRIDRLEQLLLAEKTGGLKMATGGPKKMNLPVVPGPGEGENDTGLLKVKQAANANQVSSQNFLASAFALTK